MAIMLTFGPIAILLILTRFYFRGEEAPWIKSYVGLAVTVGGVIAVGIGAWLITIYENRRIARIKAAERDGGRSE